MSTHNICFCGEIGKISFFLGGGGGVCVKNCAYLEL